MIITVDNPILNSLYREPERYWLYDAPGKQRVENGRRPAITSGHGREPTIASFTCFPTSSWSACVRSAVVCDLDG
jgi:hypothetical protein